MRIALGADHKGFPRKEELKEFLKRENHTPVDCGTFDSTSVDYPDYANAVCAKILNKEAERGILVCGTGIGMSMAANRHRGIRAALCRTAQEAKMSREHNNSNVLCLGEATPNSQEIVRTWLQTDFSGEERHARRLAKLDLV